MTPLFDPAGDGEPMGSAIGWSRGSEPSLDEERVMFDYRTISSGFGLEGVNGADEQADVAGRTLDWLLDELTVDVDVQSSRSRGSHHKSKNKEVTLTATATSSVGADIVQYRWDFGDRSRIVTTDEPTVTHRYRSSKTYDARVEVTDSLGHMTVAHVEVRVRG
jgi:hypothetical protein